MDGIDDDTKKSPRDGVQEPLFKGDNALDETPFEEIDSFDTQVQEIVSSLREKYPEIRPELLQALGIEAVQRVRATNGESALTNKKGAPPSEFFEISAAYEDVDKKINNYIAKLLFSGFSQGTMPLPLFYFYPEKWAAVCSAKDYPLQAKAHEILERDVGAMLDKVTPENSDTLRIYDFGVGTGTKGEIIIDQAIKKNGRHIEYHGVDASPDMLRIALERIAKNIMEEALDKKGESRKEIKGNKWRQLIRFLRRHDLSYSDLDPAYLAKIFKRIFVKHYIDPENVDLLKFLFARMVSLHKSDKKGRARIEELDNDVKLPLSMYAHPNWFEELDKKEFEPEGDEGLVIFDLGSEICNRFPAESIKRFYDLLSDPKTPEHEDGIVPLKEEKTVHAPYAVLGLQLGEIPTSKRQFRRLQTRMRRAYDNPAFRALTEHPFLRDDVKYVDHNTGEKLTLHDIGYIYVDYEEDQDNPGYYGSTHRLYITEDVEIHNAKGEMMLISGKERAYELFAKTVEALFEPSFEDEVSMKGRRNEIMNRLGVNSKEELLAVDPKLFFSKDYSNYGSGMRIAEELTEEEADLEQTLLYPSYKPSLEQITNLCHEGGLKVIDIYYDDKQNPTYVKILTRKMTKAEKDMYEIGNYDESIFYIPENQMTIDPPSDSDKVLKNSKRRNKRKGRKSKSKQKKQPLPKKDNANDVVKQFKAVREKRKKRSNL